jgi:hypothetical protein
MQANFQAGRPITLVQHELLTWNHDIERMQYK